MPKYIKLGEKAESFNSPTDRLHLVKGQVIELPAKYSSKIKNALRGGHITLASEVEFLKSKGETITKSEDEKSTTTKSKKQQKAEEKAKKLKALRAQLEALGDEELVEYYKSTYSVSGEDIEALEEMETEEKVTYLISLED